MGEVEFRLREFLLLPVTDVAVPSVDVSIKNVRVDAQCLRRAT
ncbi:hypothetical protein [Streptomyces sp. KN37]|nr:hypothetical protein [Streptomyces sp. KN37]WPO76322.1 hypothetical protein R9806_36645 [Streptomyces sp. KN37]WPO76804.1 hypothetical protein R9806_39780 [Streptomyces sp. KN37]